MKNYLAVASFMAGDLSKIFNVSRQELEYSFKKDLQKNKKLQKQYNKLVNECLFNKVHLKPNKEENICEHCCRTLKFPEDRIVIEHRMIIEEREKFPFIHQICDAGYWLNKIRGIEESQQAIDYYRGFERYKKSLE